MKYVLFIMTLSFNVFCFNFIEPIIKAAQKQDTKQIVDLIKEGYWFDLDKFIEPIQEAFDQAAVPFNAEILLDAQKEAAVSFYEAVVAKANSLKEKIETYDQGWLDHVFGSSWSGSKAYFLKEVHDKSISVEYQLEAMLFLVKNNPDKKITILSEGTSGPSVKNPFTRKLLHLVFLEQFMFHLRWEREQGFVSENFRRYLLEIQRLLNLYLSSQFPEPSLEFIRCDFFGMSVAHVGWDRNVDDIDTLEAKLQARNLSLANTIVASVNEPNSIAIISTGAGHCPHFGMDVGGPYFGRAKDYDEMYTLACREKNYLVLSSKTIYDTLKKHNIDHSHSFANYCFN